MIIGTAGHIDHGKTALVKALTGVDADRLPEEKARGITIDLGFAYKDTPLGGTIGFVDVPGHEKFVHTMAAGAVGMDHALLLVAADDGVMPQTREHLRVLDLLGVPDLTLVISKCDLVDPAQAARVREQASALIAATRFGAVPWYLASARSGHGIEALRNALFTRQPTLPITQAEGFRLAIDRVFVVRGMGVAVTGAVIAGVVQVGDVLRLAQRGIEVRVRSIHAQNLPAQSATRGTRCGLVIAGAEFASVERGDWLVDPSLILLTQRVDCALTVPADAERGVRDGELVLLHHGTAHRSARLILLDAAEIAPGRSGLAQCVLDRPVQACWHDRMILRDGSARHTLAGAVALDVEPPVRARKRPERIAALTCLRADNPATVLLRLLDCCPVPVNATHWARAMNLQLFSLLKAVPAGVTRLEVAGELWLVGDLARSALETRSDECLGQFHVSDPDEPGLAIERLRRMCAPALPQSVFRAWAQQAIASGRLGQTGSFVHRPGHRVELTDVERALWTKVLPLLINGHFDPPWVRDLARSLNVGEDAIRTLLRKQARQSHLVQVVHDLFYPERTMQEIASLARTLEMRDGMVGVVSFRDALQIGRKRTIQILEACDRLGLTRRLISTGRNNNASEKDHRIVRNPDLFMPGDT
ncbi:MAG: selenocysteine-specific translation elongation factor [Burkholderiaceae bacterium]|nr:selenocysteine-specific translation elongation factor [Burkholderiaceae bacterium]